MFLLVVLEDRQFGVDLLALPFEVLEPFAPPALAAGLDDVGAFSLPSNQGLTLTKMSVTFP